MKTVRLYCRLGYTHKFFIFSSAETLHAAVINLYLFTRESLEWAEETCETCEANQHLLLPDHHSEGPQASPELELGRLRTRGARVSKGGWRWSPSPGWPQPAAGWLPPQDGELCSGRVTTMGNCFVCQGLKTADLSLSAARCSHACKDPVLSLAAGLQHSRARQQPEDTLQEYGWLGQPSAPGHQGHAQQGASITSALSRVKLFHVWSEG